MTPIDDGTVSALHRALGRVSRRTAMTVSNLANVDTPGYRAQDVEFERALRSAVQMERSSGRHLGGGSLAGPGGLGPGDQGGRVVESPVTRMRADGNTVDVDVEMTKLATFQGRYTALTQMIRKRFALLRYAATDGRQ